MPTLQILGTAGYHPSEERETVSIFIPEYGFVIDAGTGFFRTRGKIKTQQLSIFLSHLHLDHSIGTTFLLDVLRGSDVKEVRIFGLKKHLLYLKNNLFGSPLFPLEFGGEPCLYKLEIIEPGSEFTHCDVKIRTKELVHPGGSIGYRFEFSDGRVLSYITDTINSNRYIDFIRDSDVLIHECHFPDSQKERAEKTGHSWTSGVARIAKRAQVKKLVLTHFDPIETVEDPTYQNEAKEVFHNTIIARDNMEISF